MGASPGLPSRQHASRGCTRTLSPPPPGSSPRKGRIPPKAVPRRQARDTELTGHRASRSLGVSGHGGQGERGGLPSSTAEARGAGEGGAHRRSDNSRPLRTRGPGRPGPRAGGETSSSRPLPTPPRPSRNHTPRPGRPPVPTSGPAGPPPSAGFSTRGSSSRPGQPQVHSTHRRVPTRPGGGSRAAKSLAGRLSGAARGSRRQPFLPHGPPRAHGRRCRQARTWAQGTKHGAEGNPGAGGGAQGEGCLPSSLQELTHRAGDSGSAAGGLHTLLGTGAPGPWGRAPRGSPEGRPRDVSRRRVEERGHSGA